MNIIELYNFVAIVDLYYPAISLFQKKSSSAMKFFPLVTSVTEILAWGAAAAPARGRGRVPPWARGRLSPATEAEIWRAWQPTITMTRWGTLHSVSWIQDVKPHYEAFNFCVLSPSLTPKVGFNFFLSLNKRGFRADKSGNISGTLNFSLLNSFTAKNMKFLTWAQFDLGNDGSWCNSCLHYWPTASL